MSCFSGKHYIVTVLNYEKRVVGRMLMVVKEDETYDQRASYLVDKYYGKNHLISVYEVQPDLSNEEDRVLFFT